MERTLHVASMDIRTWAVFVTVGVTSSWIFVLLRGRTLGMQVAPTAAWLASMFPVGALGGRLLASLVEASEIGVSGMSVVGSLFACLGYTAMWAKWVFRVSPVALLDAVAFTYPYCLVFGRIGCLLNGCCLGAVTRDRSWLGTLLSVPLSAFDPDTEVRWAHASSEIGARVWNLPAFLTVHAFFTLVVTEWAFRTGPSRGRTRGFAVGVCLAMDGLGRTALEALRGPTRAASGGIGSPWWYASLIVGLLGGVLIWMTRRRPETQSP